MSDHIRLDDLADPWLPWPVRLFNRAAAPFAARLLPLDESKLLAAASRRVGLENFGDEGFRPRLRLLTQSLEEEAKLSPFGRFTARALLLQLLTNRLLIEDYLTRHPAALEAPIERPLIIAGLPRTGTTHLHNLIAANPALRSLPMWEALEPLPMPGEMAQPPPLDVRYQRCARAMRFQDRLMPHFKRMHEMTPDAIHEEIQLLAIDVSTMLFEASYHVPSYRTWYKGSDQRGAYRYLRRILQALQHQRGRGKRWTLKTPQHLEQLGPLIEVFPDAMIVQTHRDPVRITVSLANMIAYSHRVGTVNIDPQQIGAAWAARTEDLLRGSIDGRPLIPPQQILDIHFRDFMADNLATVKKVYDFAGQPWSDEARAATEAYIADHPRGKHGTVDYRLQDVGLDADERRSALRFYTEHFDVAEEPSPNGRT